VLWSHINCYTRLRILLQRHLPTLLLRLQNQSRHIDIQLLLIEVTRDLDLDLVIHSITLTLLPAVPRSINSILYGQEYTLYGIISYISIHDKSLLLVLLVECVSLVVFHLILFEK
jgi:hypothetical protein